MKTRVESFVRSTLVACIVCLGVLVTFSCDNSDTPYYSETSDEVDNDDAKELGKIRAANTLDVKFAVIGDLHFESDYKYDAGHICWGFVEGRATHLRPVSDEINRTCKSSDYGPDCTGIVNVGDLVRVPKDSGHWDDSVATYRLFYEYDHPDGNAKGCCDDCDYCKHPAGYSQTRYPVFLGIGNHDDPTEWDETEVQDYIRKRLSDSPALFKPPPGVEISNYRWGNGSDMYAWEWGNVHFIWLGLWAFYDEFYKDGDTSNRSSVDHGKITWLENHLAAVGKDKAVLLFQHFGWDYLSLGQANKAGSHLWWDTKNTELLGDVICGREATIGGSTDCSEPYNVIGIFSGHLHEWDFHEDVVIRGDFNVSGKAADRKWNHIYERIEADNYVVNDGGHDGDGGFYLVRLNMTEPGMDGDALTMTMTVNKARIDYRDGVDYPHGDCLSYHEYDLNMNTDGGWPKIVEFTTEFLRWEQGEPNDTDGREDCAIMLPSGRYNDYECPEERHLLCYDPSHGQWHVSNERYPWKDGFEKCEDSGWVYTHPETPIKLAEAIDAVARAGGREVWVNYTDLLKEGDWQEGHEFLGFFHEAEPNNGENWFEQGWGQNCLAIMSDLSLHDFPCEDVLSSYVCRTVGGWKVTTAETAGDWRQGYHLCGDDYFKGPGLDDAGAFRDILNVAKNFFDDHTGTRAIWLPLSDLDEEGAWTSEKPWIAGRAGWKDAEPNNGNGVHEEDCALMGWDDTWYDVPCTGYHDNHFACRNYITGEWVRSDMHSTDWVDGFEACRQMGLRYYFAAPMRRDDNAKIPKIKDGIEIWLNYTDADSDAGGSLEGFWRHGYWKNWYPGQPNNQKGNENCALSMAYYDGGQWADRMCDSHHPILCRWDGHDEYAGSWTGEGATTYQNAQSRCANIGGGSKYKFTYPTCPSEQEEVNSLSYEHGSVPFWIQFNDNNLEGLFLPW